MNPKAVALPGANPRNVAVVGKRSDLLESEPALVVVLVEEAQLDAVRILGVDGKVCTLAVIGGSERM